LGNEQDNHPDDFDQSADKNGASGLHLGFPPTRIIHQQRIHLSRGQPMNFIAAKISGSNSLSHRHQAAFTLVEVMVAMSLFSVLIMAIIACSFAGLKLNEYVKPKLENAEYARRTVSRLIAEVRCANSIQVGTGTKLSFTPAGASQAQIGNALRIYPSTNTSQFIYYFHDNQSKTMQRVPLLSSTAFVIASAVTNNSVFTMENYAGNVLTNSQNNAVVSVLLQMRRGSAWNNISDAYQVRARATRRNIL
jgi:prepilin-type N-terminal cleavage/methylation domain-containing protein